MQAPPTSSREVGRIRTLVISDQSLVLGELRHFLRMSSEILLLGKMPDCGRVASRLVKKYKPDVLLLDGTATGGRGLAALTELKAEYPRLPFVLLASQDSRTYALQAFRSGASGYVLSMSGEVHIVEAIREVHAGRLYLCPRILQLFLSLPYSTLPAVAASGHEARSESRKTLPLNKGKTA